MELVFTGLNVTPQILLLFVLYAKLNMPNFIIDFSGESGWLSAFGVITAAVVCLLLLGFQKMKD